MLLETPDETGALLEINLVSPKATDGKNSAMNE